MLFRSEGWTHLDFPPQRTPVSWGSARRDVLSTDDHTPLIWGLSHKRANCPLQVLAGNVSPCHAHSSLLGPHWLDHDLTPHQLILLEIQYSCRAIRCCARAGPYRSLPGEEARKSTVPYEPTRKKNQERSLLRRSFLYRSQYCTAGTKYIPVVNKVGA